ncbi:nitrogen-fixing NifU domain protein [Isosphaera pallida ATCC 43644]|uniref:Nitrogen-fixing NifU domain protein n=1 Tax=Isosphaera pallida (strain ATCC 43644 / DSM 9630 / IS1B) TaxID=575540 RepID=E8QWP5_ISOPI|nr:NifU family protein [Isosphaera pallida]ADV62945.1 nitrogen-fixing NifU domain protein [Isosphaera pallida ATCC 43644]
MSSSSASINSSSSVRPPSLSLEEREGLKREVSAAIAEEVAPGLGGEEVVQVVQVDEDCVAQVRFSGVCASCPATAQAILLGIEAVVRRRVPSVKFVEAVV